MGRFNEQLFFLQATSVKSSSDRLDYVSQKIYRGYKREQWAELG